MTQTNNYATAASQVQGSPEAQKADAVRSLERLRMVVLLAGAVHPTPLQTDLGRSMLDLPIDERRSILNHWQDHVSTLAQQLGRDHLETRVMVDWTATAPISAWDDSRSQIEIERDPLELRGTGGVLHDLAKELDDDEVLLVISAKQLMYEPLAGLTLEMSQLGGDVSLVAYDDGTPSGVMLCRCGALRKIAPIGFVDMKEQALPLIAKHYKTHVLHRETSLAQPMRDRVDYLRGLRRLHGKAVKNGEPTFNIVEVGAHVDPTASLHDAVVLRGSHVGRDAVVARSLVGDGAQIKPRQVVVDQLVAVGSGYQVV